jgi:hypothetical protein
MDANVDIALPTRHLETVPALCLLKGLYNLSGARVSVEVMIPPLTHWMPLFVHFDPDEHAPRLNECGLWLPVRSKLRAVPAEGPGEPWIFAEMLESRAVVILPA